MPYNPSKHHRRSVRLKGYDYSQPGAYFVTICVTDRRCIFGDIAGGQMHLNDAGRCVDTHWGRLVNLIDCVELGEWIVMPNHLHGIVLIHERTPDGKPARRKPLGEIVGAFKTNSTKELSAAHGLSGRPVWQRDFFDHVVRNHWSYDRISEYIATNPQRWEKDAENPQGTGQDDVSQWVTAMDHEAKGGSRAAPTGALGVIQPVRSGADAIRLGHGYDLHRLQPGGQLVLGGVVVADNLSPISHSDGDVVIHALVDAILGALAKGDIGEHFPDSDPAWKGAASILFLDKTLDLARQAGYRVVNADVTILAEKPRLKPFKSKMVALLSNALGGAPVNVKAGTNEGCDAVGRGEAIAAHAVVLLARDI